MAYVIREVMATLQGEGMRTGHRSVFVRFAGCNLWSGDPAKRAYGSGACARWCDTDFQHQKSLRMTAQDIIDEVERLWPQDRDRWVVLTGGEPMLQLVTDPLLLEVLGDRRIWTAIETNGTVPLGYLGSYIDHVCVSPKLDTKGAPLKLRVHAGDEMKVILPGADFGLGWTEEMLETLYEETDFGAYYLQPADPIKGAEVEVSWLRNGAADHAAYVKNVQRVLEHVSMHPHWKLSLQTHKFIGLP